MLRRAHAEALHQAESSVRASRRIRTNLGSTGVSTPERPRRTPLVGGRRRRVTCRQRCNGHDRSPTRSRQERSPMMPSVKLARLFAVSLAALSSAGIDSAVAVDSPTRPVRWIVPYTPGGGTDITARIVAQWLSERLGQQVFIENKPGGGNNIGTEAALHSPADG